jgi:Protein of unknown function (DUF2804)
MRDLPTRGPAVRRLGLPLPPLPMPALSRGRPLKRWRYVGVYRPDVMLCVGDARVGGVPQRWWAVALPDGALLERTTHGRGGVLLEPGVVRVRARGVSIELALEEPAPVEVASPHGRSWIWTAKRAPVLVRGRVETPRGSFDLDGEDGFIDESAGYHARHTAWRWSAGVGRAADGRRVAWNLVDGVHDSDVGSERTVWLDGEPSEVEPQAFAPDLSAVGGLSFRAWSVREQRMFRGYARSWYRQPFGEFGGELPRGIRLAEAYGVMEEHDVRW